MTTQITDLEGLGNLRDNPKVVATKARADHELEMTTLAERELKDLEGRLTLARASASHPDDVDEIERLEGLVEDGKKSLEKARLRLNLARRVLTGAREEAAAEMRAELMPLYQEAIVRLNATLRAAQAANAEVVRIFLIGERLRPGFADGGARVAILPSDLYWPELQEPAGSQGETRYHAWRRFVRREIGLDLSTEEEGP